jgi:glycerone phosphate O-acyltransferase/fatty acyl-CoA reductase
VIINSAAAVDFINTLDKAMRDNFYNTMRMLKFAKECKRLEVLVHVSTAYSNSNRVGYIEEKLYTSSRDIDEIIKHIKSLSKEELNKQTASIVKGYPNTYTFAKFLAEHKLSQNKDDLSMAIVRPTIIGASYEEPFPGWVDSVSALTGVYFYFGLGIAKELYANKKVVLDVVSVDYCANMIIAAGAYQANKKTLEIFHSGSSSVNPVTCGELLDYMKKYLTDHPTKAFVNKKIDGKFYVNEQVYNSIFFVKRKLPVILYDIWGKITKSEEIQSQVALYKKVLMRTSILNFIFKTFTTTNWVFSTEHSKLMDKYFTQQDFKDFPYSMKEVDWNRYSNYYLYGLWTYVGNEKHDYPYTTNYENFFCSEDYSRFDRKLFGDLRFISHISKFVEYRNTDLRMKTVLELKEIRRAIDKYIEQRKKELKKEKKPIRESRLEKEVKDKAKQYARRMEPVMRKGVAISFCYFTHKYLKQIFNRININPSEIERIKKLQHKGPLVFVSNHRSYMDFLILTYIILAYGLEPPYIAASEDFLKVPIISTMFRSVGAFFIKRGYKADPVYHAILREYTKHILMEGNSLEFYIEGKRSRRGKLLQPKLGMLKILVEALAEKRVKEIYVVPVSISYERVLEAESFTQEFVGEGKVGESLSRLIKGASTLTHTYGIVHLGFSSPIKLSECVERGKAKDGLLSLGNKILHDVSSNIHVMATEVVASLIVVRKKLTLKELAADFDIIRKELIRRGIRIVLCFVME